MVNEQVKAYAQYLGKLAVLKHEVALMWPEAYVIESGGKIDVICPGAPEEVTDRVAHAMHLIFFEQGRDDA